MTDTQAYSRALPAHIRQCAKAGAALEVRKPVNLETIASLVEAGLYPHLAYNRAKRMERRARVIGVLSAAALVVAVWVVRA
jgi:hypothetical protein